MCVLKCAAAVDQIVGAHAEGIDDVVSVEAFDSETEAPFVVLFKAA